MVDIQIDKKSDNPLYAQVRDRIRQAIADKELAEGDKLPSVAALAKQVGVTQATIRRAVEDLTQMGLVKSHVGRGTFIEPITPDHTAGRIEYDHPGARGRIQHVPHSREFRHVTQTIRNGISKGLIDLMRLARQSDMINFSNGTPDPGLLEPDFLKTAAAEVLATDQTGLMGCADSQGLYELRQVISERYCKNGIAVTPAQVLITNGSQQAASILAIDAAEQRWPVLCETPCYQGIPETFNIHGNWVDTVPRDHFGPIPDRLQNFKNHPSLLYISPELHNPIGTDLSDERQSMIIAWAKETNSLVLSDEIFQDLRTDGPQPKSILQQLGAEQTVVISSISKSLIPGLRVGWMISSAERIQAYTRLKRLMDQACPPLMQAIALNLFQSGKYDRHLETLKSIYIKRRQVLFKNLDQFMPKGVSWTAPKGGYSMWITLPEGYSSIALLLSAIDKRVNFLPGPLFDLDQRYISSFRLSWAWTDEQQIAEGVEILADAIKELFRQPPGEAGLSGLGNFQ